MKLLHNRKIIISKQRISMSNLPITLEGLAFALNDLCRNKQCDSTVCTSAPFRVYVVINSLCLDFITKEFSRLTNENLISFIL